MSPEGMKRKKTGCKVSYFERWLLQIQLFGNNSSCGGVVVMVEWL